MESPENTAYSNTENALRMLVVNCLAFQKDSPRASSLPPKARVRELCTVKLCGPRMSGHTSAMLAVAKQFGNPKFIVANESMRENLVRLNEVSRDDIFLQSNFPATMRGLKDVDAVFVDCSSFMSATKEEELFSLCSCLFVGQTGSCLVFLE